MTSFRGQASWAKMTSPRGKLTALVCHPNKRVNKAEELMYLYTNIDSSCSQNDHIILRNILSVNALLYNVLYSRFDNFIVGFQFIELQWNIFK